MNSAVISLGSNLPNQGMQILSRALCDITEQCACHLIAATQPYADAADNNSDAPYTNVVAIVITDVEYDRLKSELKELEVSYGRTPMSKLSGLVPLDLDIVIFNDKIMKASDYKRHYFTMGFEMIESEYPCQLDNTNP